MRISFTNHSKETQSVYIDEGDFARTLTWCMAGGTVTNVDVVVDSFWGKFE